MRLSNFPAYSQRGNDAGKTRYFRSVPHDAPSYHRLPASNHHSFAKQPQRPPKHSARREPQHQRSHAAVPRDAAGTDFLAASIDSCKRYVRGAILFSAVPSSLFLYNVYKLGRVPALYLDRISRRISIAPHRACYRACIRSSNRNVNCRMHAVKSQRYHHIRTFARANTMRDFRPQGRPCKAPPSRPCRGRIT